jgi:hypothetical protein
MARNAPRRCVEAETTGMRRGSSWAACHGIGPRFESLTLVGRRTGRKTAARRGQHRDSRAVRATRGSRLLAFEALRWKAVRDDDRAAGAEGIDRRQRGDLAADGLGLLAGERSASRAALSRPSAVVGSASAPPRSSGRLRGTICAWGLLCVLRERPSSGAGHCGNASPLPRGVFRRMVLPPCRFPLARGLVLPPARRLARRKAGAGRRFGACLRNCTGDLCLLWAPGGAPHVAISDSGTALFVSRPLVAASPSASSSRAVLMPPGGDPEPPGTAGPLGPPARAPHPLPVVRCGTGHGLLGGGV